MLEVIYQDDHCIAINKPSGMLVHRSWLDTNETIFAMQLLRNQIGQHVYPVHRLDRPTSGVLLFAKDNQSARHLATQFEHHHIKKSYLAIVRGYLPTSGHIDYPLKARWDKIADKFANPNPTPKDAITDYHCLATTEQPFVSQQRFATSRYSLARLTPKTGRKHQLRRHMKHIFHPIIGDTTYGDKAQNRAFLTHLGTKRLLLHAHSLTFNHPITQQPITITAPLDEQFWHVCSRFGWCEHDKITPVKQVFW